MRVEGGKLILQGEREVKRGNSFSKRHFNQRFDLPQGIDVDSMYSEVKEGGKLVITAPQLKKEGAGGASDEGTKEVTKTGETTTTTSEGEIQLEGGGSAKTSKTSTSGKKSQVTAQKKELGDGAYEEEIVEEEEFFEESSSTSTSTMTFGGSGADFGGFGDFPSLTGSGGAKSLLSGMELSLPSLGEGPGGGEDLLGSLGGLAAGATVMGGTSKTTKSTTEEKMKSEGGQVVEMSKKESTTSDVKEMAIPISKGSKDPSKSRAPRQRALPFDLGDFDFSMPSADDLMAKVQAQMSQMQQETTTQVEQQQQATATKASAAAAPSKEEVMHSEFFVPLRNIGSVQKNALADATAMAKRKGDNFELVVNIQRFTPEQVKVFASGQSVIVQAKNVDADGFVTDDYEQKFNLPDDVDTTR